LQDFSGRGDVVDLHVRAAHREEAFDHRPQG